MSLYLGTFPVLHPVSDSREEPLDIPSWCLYYNCLFTHLSLQLNCEFREGKNSGRWGMFVHMGFTWGTWGQSSQQPQQPCR